MVSTEMTSSRIFIDEEEFNPPDWFVGEEEDIIEPLPTPSYTDSSFYIVFVVTIAFVSVIVIVIIKKKDFRYFRNS